MTAVVVSLIYLLHEIELIGPEILVITEQLCHVHGLETCRQCVILCVVPIVEVTGLVVTCTVLTVDTRLQFWLPITELELMLFISLKRYDVLIQ